MTERSKAAAPVWLAALVVAGALLAGCDPGDPAPPPEQSGASTSATASARISASPSAAPTLSVEADYFTVGQCAKPTTNLGPDGSKGIALAAADCAEALVVAKVTGRSEPLPPVGADDSFGSICADDTDFALDLMDNLFRTTGAHTSGQTAYACLRYTGSTHPGDPGMGGGLRILEGDCLYTTTASDGGRKADEARCDGTGDNPPEYKVTKRFTKGLAARGQSDSCPPSTAVEFELSRTGTTSLLHTVICAGPL
ncbi:hypothetical protein AB0K43_19020 [Kitasatospora sp. NPDC049258]|uniref:hypothetical protein n=1 Tax=Kitasatospora sp. NPDC049258 TaxID=3155394 RepID=UPI00342550AF